MNERMLEFAYRIHYTTMCTLQTKWCFQWGGIFGIACSEKGVRKTFGVSFLSESVHD
jgi:hypothetical protein